MFYGEMMFQSSSQAEAIVSAIPSHAGKIVCYTKDRIYVLKGAVHSKHDYYATQGKRTSNVADNLKSFYISWVYLKR